MYQFDLPDLADLNAFRLACEKQGIKDPETLWQRIQDEHIVRLDVGYHRRLIGDLVKREFRQPTPAPTAKARNRKERRAAEARERRKK